MLVRERLHPLVRLCSAGMALVLEDIGRAGLREHMRSRGERRLERTIHSCLLHTLRPAAFPPADPPPIASFLGYVVQPQILRDGDDGLRAAQERHVEPNSDWHAPCELLGGAIRWSRLLAVVHRWYITAADFTGYYIQRY